MNEESQDFIDTFFNGTKQTEGYKLENYGQLLLEWYHWSTFSEIEEIGKGGYGTVFRAKRQVERIYEWDHEPNQWSRIDRSTWYKEFDQCKEYVALKTIGHCESLSKDFMNEVTNLYLLYV